MISGSSLHPDSTSYRDMSSSRHEYSGHKRDGSVDTSKLRMSRSSTGNVKESVVREITHEAKLVEVRRLEPVEIESHTL